MFGVPSVTVLQLPRLVTEQPLLNGPCPLSDGQGRSLIACLGPQTAEVAAKGGYQAQSLRFYRGLLSLMEFRAL